jgi:hypothetical protein
MIYIPIIWLIFSQFNPGEFMIDVHKKISNWSKNDREKKEIAENLSSQISQIHNINLQLRRLELACTVGTVLPPAAKAIQVTAKGLAVYQDILVQTYSIFVNGLKLKGTTYFETPFRKASLVCNIPGATILSSNKKIISYRDQESGFEIFAKNKLSDPSWVFDNPNVRALR